MNIILVIVCLAVLAAGTARAQDWLPELRPPPGGGDFWQPGDPIALTIPADLPDERFQSLALEVDAFDVSALVERQGNLLVYSPPQALAPGPHSLRLVENLPDGSIVELGSWQFEVRQSELLRELEGSADLAGQITYRLLNDNLFEAPARLQGDSAGQGQGMVADGNWRLSANANYFFNSQQDLTNDNRRLDLGEYLIEGDYASEDLTGGIKLGHQNIGAQDFVMSDFYRRGLSFRLGTGDRRAQLTAFALRSESTLGIPHFTGVGESNNRVQGFHLDTRPIESLKDNIRFTGTVYDGEGETIGAGQGGFDDRNDGTGFSVAADSTWFDDSLRFRSEFAMTRFDFDGEDGSFEPETDHSYSFLASYAPIQGEQIGEDFVSWDISAQHERVGTLFASLANPFISSDRITTTVGSNLNWGEFAVQAQVGRQTNNVEAFNELPRDRTYNGLLFGSYSPFIEPEEDGSLPWFGQPNLNLSFNFVDNKQTDVPDSFAGFSSSNQLRSASIGVGSSYERWSWNLTESVSSFEDRSNNTSDTINFLTDLSGQVQIIDEVRVSPYAQWNYLREKDDGDKGHNFNLGLDATIDWIPEVLSSSLNYSLNLASGVGDTPDSHFAGGELLWTLLPAEVNRPGLALSLTGSYQYIRDDRNDFFPAETYQVFSSLKVVLPVAY